MYVSATVLSVCEWATFTTGDIFMNDTKANFAAASSETFEYFFTFSFDLGWPLLLAKGPQTFYRDTYDAIFICSFAVTRDFPWVNFRLMICHL